MTIAIDANLALGAAIPQPYSPQIVATLRMWQQNNERLIAPYLFEYEVTTALRRAVTIGIFDQQTAIRALQTTLSLGIELIAPSQDLDLSALALAERIGQSKAHDAQYLALAVRENATLWTADRRLAQGAATAGLALVRWIGDREA